MHIYYPDGKGMGYRKATDSEPRNECRFTIEEGWTDKEGNIYYKVLEKWSRRPYDESRARTYYTAIKIQPSGNVMETVAYEGTHYEEIRPSDPRHTIHYRK